MKDKKCPSCDAKLDSATGLNNDDEPKPGDLTICAYCSTVLKVTKTGLEKLSHLEFFELSLDHEEIFFMIGKALIELKHFRKEVRNEK